MPALLMTISMPSGCSSFKNLLKSWMLFAWLMSSSRNLMVVSPPSWASTLACLSCGSLFNVLTASAPRSAERAVR